MIRVKDADKSFDKNKALDGLCINVERGSIYGLVGTNGAGKTTIIKGITGVLMLDGGQITIDDEPVFENSAVKQRIGYVSDDPFAFRSYSLREMAKYTSGLYESWNEKRYKALVSEYGLDDRTKLSSYSKGMRKQAAFILALSTMPEYLILDEPIDGLDPLVRRKTWKFIIEDVAEREMTVLVSSHNLREMEGYCDHIGIISQGKMIIERDLEDLKSDVHKVQIAFRDEEDDTFAKALGSLNVMHHEKRGSVHLAIVREPADVIKEALKPYDTPVLDMLPLTLEEIFVYELGGDGYEINEIIQ